MTTATAITGKRATFEYASADGTAQITTMSIAESGSSNTIQTLGGSVTVAQGVESSVSCDFLFDGDASGGGFYGALKSALADGLPGTLTIEANGASWTGQALVTSLGADIPADDAVTCSAEFGISGALPFTAPGTVPPVE